MWTRRIGTNGVVTGVQYWCIETITVMEIAVPNEAVCLSVMLINVRYLSYRVVNRGRQWHARFR